MSSSIGFGMQPRSKLSQESLRFARNWRFHARVRFDNVGLSPQYSKQYVFVTSICFNRMGLSPLYSKQWVVCHLNVLNNMGLSPQYVLTIWGFTSIFLTKWVCHLNIWEEEKDDWDQLVLKPVMIMMPRIKTMMLVKMVLMMMLMTKTWCWEWCGQDGVDDDVDDKDLHDDDEGSTQPLGGKGQQGEEEHVRGRVRNELDKRVSHEPGNKKYH